MDKITPSQAKLIEMLNTLTDAELCYHFPKLNKMTRDEKIKWIVFGLK